MANGNLNPTKDHNHGQDLDKIETSKRREEMKCLALSTVAGPSSIQAGVLMHANTEVKACIGTKEACSQTMARARKKSFPANPNNLNQLVIQNEFATTGGANPVRFLLHDNGAGNAINSRIVIFSSDANLRHLASAGHWSADGNFKLVPGIFQQLYVIRVRLGDTYITVLYVYLQHKNQVAYTEMWSVVQFCAILCDGRKWSDVKNNIWIITRVFKSKFL